MTYRATQADDGTWTIHDVEIFATIPAGECGMKDGIGEAWLKRCAGLMQEEHAKGYLPPVHLLHHGDAPGGVPTLVGHFRVTRVGEWNGESCLIADLCGVPDGMYAEIAAGRWPYRSAEVPIGEDPRISSLALLSSQPPHFRFPLLIPDAPVAEWTAPPESPLAVAAYSHVGNGLVACFKFEGETEKLDESEKPDEAEQDAKSKADADAPEGDGDDADAEEEKPDTSGRILAGIERLLDLIDPERQKAAANAEAAAQDRPASAPADPARMAADAVTAKLRGENAALKLMADRTAAQASEDAIVAEAVAELAEFTLTSAEKADLRALAASGGKDAVAVFTRTLKGRAVADPPKSLAAAVGTPAAVELDPPEVARFADRGPDALELARAKHRQWQVLRASGYMTSLSAFLDTQVK